MRVELLLGVGGLPAFLRVIRSNGSMRIPFSC